MMASVPRKVIDCRLFPSDRNCTLAISGTEEEVLEIAVQHAVASHGHEKTPELREKLRSLLRDDTGERKPAGA
jgi:predicted small metal-binding protein